MFFAKWADLGYLHNSPTMQDTERSCVMQTFATSIVYLYIQLCLNVFECINKWT